VTTVYIVMGSNGEYSDRDEWMVAAYLGEAKANEHAQAANVALSTFEALSSDERDELAGDCLSEWINPLDSVHGFCPRLCGQGYRVKTVDLLDEVPK
jgi:hypothetical protein